MLADQRAKVLKSDLAVAARETPSNLIRDLLMVEHIRQQVADIIDTDPAVPINIQGLEGPLGVRGLGIPILRCCSRQPLRVRYLPGLGCIYGGENSSGILVGGAIRPRQCREVLLGHASGVAPVRRDEGQAQLLHLVAVQRPERHGAVHDGALKLRSSGEVTDVPHAILQIGIDALGRRDTHGLKPRVLDGFAGRGPLRLIGAEQPLEERAAALGEHGPADLSGKFVRILVRIPLWRHARNHLVHHRPEREQVCRGSVGLAQENLRGHVAVRARAPREQALVGMVAAHHATDTKIHELQRRVGISGARDGHRAVLRRFPAPEEEVLRLDIPVHDRVPVAISETPQHLHHDPSDVFLLDAKTTLLVPSLDVLGERSPRAHLHDEVVILVVLEGLVVSDDVRVVCHLKKLNLSAELLRILDLLVVDGLDGHNLAGASVPGRMNNSKSSFAHLLKQLIEVLQPKHFFPSAVTHTLTAAPANERTAREATGPWPWQVVPQGIVELMLELGCHRV
mmetsp:Transcript_3389/g.10356  ORF Transcript_3389/g.10356 Transcript_3389/m.10356 type:complete len:510 (-) Transcript_3389:250-1779(-)